MITPVKRTGAIYLFSSNSFFAVLITVGGIVTITSLSSLWTLLYNRFDPSSLTVSTPDKLSSLT